MRRADTYRQRGKFRAVHQDLQLIADETGRSHPRAYRWVTSPVVGLAVLAALGEGLIVAGVPPPVIAALVIGLMAGILVVIVIVERRRPPS